jgi:tRNA nucleotidyltransferase (CCA-adding enzyme)
LASVILRKKEEGRRKKEEGRRKKEEGRKIIQLLKFTNVLRPNSQFPILNAQFPMINYSPEAL